MDDGSSPEITLLIPFIFFNIPYRSIYVSLDQDSHHYCTEPQLIKLSTTLILMESVMKFYMASFYSLKIKGLRILVTISIRTPTEAI